MEMANQVHILSCGIAASGNSGEETDAIGS